jgi:prepilin-type N-terminal cleavage/methylation domain-containing protein
MSAQRGFTLIEIAIVVVIIGLLLGGVLKGQELITNARVRALISQQDGIKAAYFGFLDRYRALPGDYSQATSNISGVTANGNGNGLITPQGVAGGPPDQNTPLFGHPSRAGYLTGSYTYAGGAENTASAPTNSFGRFLKLVYDDVYDGTPTNARHNLKTGNQIPADLLGEVDRKIDDGRATSGSFRFSAYPGQTGASEGAPAGEGTCYLAAAPNEWNVANSSPNCGAANPL